MHQKTISGMKIPALILTTFSFLTVQAQYYYNDIIATLETNRQMQVYQANKVKMITATGLDANGVKATDFAEVQEVKENGRALKVSSRNSGSYNVYYNKYDEKGRIVSTIDSSSAIQSSITYQYDETGKIIKFQNILTDPSNEFNQTETHQWIYNANGKPEKMWRIINNTDSLEVKFIPDENGNPGEEVTFKKGVETGRLYYYFDEQNRITDIVRYNKKVKKLLPDVIISYDDAGRVIQKITSTPGDNYGRVTWVGYIIWRYIYNDKGLKTKEALFNKDRELTGKIEYTYNFSL